VVFNDWVTLVCTALEIPLTPIVGGGPSGDANFNAIYPRAIEYIEQRLQKELDLLGATVTDETGVLSANTRVFTLPTSTGNFIVTTQVSPGTGASRAAPLLPVSRSFIETVWPSDTAPAGTLAPTYWAPRDQVSILVGPPVTAPLAMSVTGEQRFVPLSPGNPSNFLSVYFPDLYNVGSLVFLAGYQRDFGAMSDDPSKAQSWEAQYQTLQKSAAVEEARKKFESVGWSPRLPSPIATPPKT
jgi:hypothetical protein